MNSINWNNDKNVIIAILIIIVIFIIVFYNKADNLEQSCTCYEVVGDESNYVCYTPHGEIDTEGECVGPKTY